MQGIIDYNFLIIGRSGAGKSATSKLLTGDPSITVANSLNEVTKTVNFYRGISHTIQQEHVRFGILDIPGLDRLDNRFALRQTILYQLQRLKISLHGVIYIASMTQRDTIQGNKLFDFLEQLPWASQLRKNALIPIFTKYDNLLIDSPEADIQRTNQEFHKIFTERGYETAWNKRIYWINFTKSLDFKIKINQTIRQTYETQIQRLIQITKKNKKHILTSKTIRQYIEAQQKYVLENLSMQVQQNLIPYIKKQQSQKLSLQIKIQPKKISKGVTAVSASSIGIIMSKALQKQFPAPICVIIMGIPLSLALVNLATNKPSHKVTDKVSFQEASNLKVIQNYQNHLCQQLNQKLENQWTELNRNIEFYIQSKKLVCKVSHVDPENYNFFDLSNMKIQEISTTQQNNKIFNKIDTKNYNYNIFQLPLVDWKQNFNQIFDEQIQQSEKLWDPVIQITYQVKAFDEVTLVKNIQKLRMQFGAE